MLFGALQLYIGTLGAELFLSRTSFVISLVGAVLLLGGTDYLRKLSFPLFLLFFMVPIPAVVYNQITFPLQVLASQVSRKRTTSTCWESRFSREEQLNSDPRAPRGSTLSKRAVGSARS